MLEMLKQMILDYFLVCNPHCTNDDDFIKAANHLKATYDIYTQDF